MSDIMEEDEEELYSEMQLEDGGRRRVSVTSHNALKVNKCSCRETLGGPPCFDSSSISVSYGFLQTTLFCSPRTGVNLVYDEK